jgi:hypothetical protein
MIGVIVENRCPFFVRGKSMSVLFFEANLEKRTDTDIPPERRADSATNAWD